MAKKKIKKRGLEVTLKKGDDIEAKIEGLFGEMDRRYARQEFDLAEKGRKLALHNNGRKKLTERERKKLRAYAMQLKDSSIKEGYGLKNPAHRGKNAKSGY